MKGKSIRSHLKAQKILAGRKTTIVGAFNKALAAFDEYQREAVDEAIRMLGQNPEDDLRCVYCGGAASTWDHLYNTTRRGEYTGFGSHIRNLVPACSGCNSKKAGKDWRAFVRGNCGERANQIIGMIAEYSKSVNESSMPAQRIDDICPDLMKNYRELREQILELMGKADEVASQIRHQIAQGSEK